MLLIYELIRPILINYRPKLLIILYVYKPILLIYDEYIIHLWKSIKISVGKIGDSAVKLLLECVILKISLTQNKYILQLLKIVKRQGDKNQDYILASKVKLSITHTHTHTHVFLLIIQNKNICALQSEKHILNARTCSNNRM